MLVRIPKAAGIRRALKSKAAMRASRIHNRRMSSMLRTTKMEPK